MSLFFANKFVASIVITALTATTVLTPVVAMASNTQVKTSYKVQATQSLINTLTRLGGYDRRDTAVQIAEHGWKTTSIAVLAPSGDQNMVDALASSTLAKAVDGPILLADIDSVPASTLAELSKLKVTKVYLVSGTAVISTNVEAQLTKAGIQSVRLGGYDRYATAVNIAKEVQKIKPFQEIVVANAFANVDAISIAPIAAAKGIPVLLVDKDSVPKVVSDFIKASGITKTYVIGGTAVVSDSVKNELPNASRLGGYDLYDTNLEVLKQFKNFIVGGSMFFANGSDTSLVDSLAGAPLAAKFGGAIVLSNKEAVPVNTKSFIQTDITLKNPLILGGTAVMSDSAVQNLGYSQPGQSATLNGAVELNTPNATFKDVTVNGNILIDAEGETLQNVNVKGTVFVDPGKDGSATLDGVQATRIVVLSGADHSIHMKNTKSDSLLVSSSSPGTNLVAESGTIIGSTIVQSNGTLESQSGANIGVLTAQPRVETQIAVGLQGTFTNDVALSGSVKLTAKDGAVVSNVKVANAASPEAFQLAGQFVSVSITDSSSVTVVSGAVAKMATATASSIVVKQGAVVTNLSSSSGSVTLSGGGIVNDKVTTATPISSVIPLTPGKGVDDLITALPAVADLALTNKAAVVAARGSYTALTSDQQATVTKLSILIADEAKIVTLQAAADKVTADQAAGKSVDDAITALPAEADLALNNKEAVVAARAAYTALTTDQQATVTKLNILIADKAKIVTIQVSLGIITGTITDSNGKALAGIVVNIYSENSFNGETTKTTTDADGRYTINGWTKGTYYSIQLDPTSYNSINNTNWASTGQEVTIVEGQTVPNINVKLTQGGSMSP